jgi:hypothetical protein
MRGIFSVNFSFIPALVIATLLLSFGMHSVQISHGHHGHTGDHGNTADENKKSNSGTSSTLGDYIHSAADKKFFIILASVALLSVGMTGILFGSWTQFILHENLRYYSFFRKRRELVSHITRYLQLFLSRGILHPKLY